MLKLKYVIDEIEEVIGPLRDYYAKADDGKFHLSLDGESAKLNEFRTNNRVLHTAKTELEAKLAAFEGIDPKAAKDALARLPELETKLKDAETVGPRITDLESQLAAEKASHAATQFKQMVTYEFLRAGGRESAVDFTVANAAKTFKMVDGKPTTDVFSAKNPGVPLTLEEWVADQYERHDFTFKPSRGGGAGGSASRPPAKRVVSKDPLEFGKNIEDIASGKATVG